MIPRNDTPLQWLVDYLNEIMCGRIGIFCAQKSAIKMQESYRVWRMSNEIER